MCAHTDQPIGRDYLHRSIINPRGIELPIKDLERGTDYMVDRASALPCTVRRNREIPKEINASAAQ